MLSIHLDKVVSVLANNCYKSLIIVDSNYDIVAPDQIDSTPISMIVYQQEEKGESFKLAI
jgi:hypothetical protein